MKLKFLSIIFFLSSVCFFAQDSHQSEKKLDWVFGEIENAIQNGDINKLSIFFSSQTYFSLADGRKGFFSSNQAYYILDDFFKKYKIITFKFNTISNKSKTPYANGSYVSDYRGAKSTSKVYISLKDFQGDWKITQITIN